MIREVGRRKLISETDATGKIQADNFIGMNVFNKGVFSFD